MSDPLRPPTKETPRNPDDYRRVDMAADVLASESHRGAIIFAGSLVDETLESLIKSKLRADDWSAKNVVAPMFEGYGPLASFSARIRHAYALGLICREAFDALELLRKLRNDFAHEPRPMNLDNEKVKARFVAFANIFGFSGRPLMQGQAPEETGLRLLLASLMGMLEGYLHSCALNGGEQPWQEFPKDMDALTNVVIPMSKERRAELLAAAKAADESSKTESTPQGEGAGDDANERPAT